MAEITKATWKARQHRLNLFTKKHVKGVGALREDGVAGPATVKRIKECQYWLGWEKQNGKWSDKLAAGLRHPRSSKPTSRATVLRGIRRRARHNASYLRSYLQPGVTRFDGVPVAKAAVPILRWCRAHGWDGHLVSGWRSKAYSQRLCYQICGHPTCPGRCAGIYTNHVQIGPRNFALDVSSYVKFKQVVAQCPLRPRLRNALPNDPVHFSPSGR